MSERNPWEEAEHFQNVCVRPLIAAVETSLKSQIQPIVDAQVENKRRLDEHEMALNSLKAGNKKAMIGYGVYATVAAAAVGSAWGWIRTKFKIV